MGKQKPRITKDRATVEYLQQMLRELRQMADAARDDMLVYLIDMAYVEAGDRLRAIHAAQLEAATALSCADPAAQKAA